MRARANDLVELFGFAPDDSSDVARSFWDAGTCPFVGGPCIKRNHNKTITYGACSATTGITGDDVIICPNRLYADNYRLLADIVDATWAPAGSRDIVAGGTLAELSVKARKYTNPVVAFGNGSGKEISVSGRQMSMDWVLQSYKTTALGAIEPQEFVGVEVQSIDITGNYRANWAAYRDQRYGQEVTVVPESNHGLNWANVHKRLIPQIIRKGNVYSSTSRCIGFFFIVPECVFKRFEEVLGRYSTAASHGRDVVSVLTYELGPSVPEGQIRHLVHKRTCHIPLAEVSRGFTTYVIPGAPASLDRSLLNIL